MDGNPSQSRKVQLDKKEREHLEDVVTKMRERVEANVRYQLKNEYNLDEKPNDDSALTEAQQELVGAIELEAIDENNWGEGYEQYLTSVGYTVVNRLAALRCMEVRGFINDEVTQFREGGLTPAADRLVTEEFMIEEEAVIEAYRKACDNLAEEIEILFDRSSAYSLIDPDDDTYEDLCGMLDEISDEVWRADDVLGWVYEYYNVKLLDDLRQKGDNEGLEPEDVPAANQFYTPHWVVRMLTDNSLGKLYLEDQGELQNTVERQNSMTTNERKDRPLSPNESPDIKDFCTYLVPSEEEGEPPDFDDPEDIKVIDPACGSGHFLLYAFDVLERIYRAETDLDHTEIPREILRNNLHGVDLDMRACQLAAFNLYLKARTRVEAEGANGFDMPEVGIVCADAKVADIGGVEEVFDEVADGKSDVKHALRRILDVFEEIHGLGSLLDVRGTLSDIFEDDTDQDSVQIKLSEDPNEDHTLGQILHSLRKAVDQHQNEDSFLARDLRSFIRLLDLLAQDYDVALMNPPYGSQGRMPDVVESYVEQQYEYGPEFYINFYEVCEELVQSGGRIGMLIPRSFMFKRSYSDFRTDFLQKQGAFDYLAEFGLGILDNATVRTVGTVVRPESKPNKRGSFIRLHDLKSNEKESVFVEKVLSSSTENDIKRLYEVEQNKFEIIPGNPISYWTPEPIRNLHNSNLKLDPDAGGTDGEAVCTIATGLQTGDNERFIRKHWEVSGIDFYKPLAKGSSEAWILPSVTSAINWRNEGAEVSRIDSAVVRNSQHYGKEALTWNHIKATGRRFGYYPPGGIFDQTGSVVLPGEEIDSWLLLGILNSDLYHSLFLSLTPERHWNPGDVGKIPWDKKLQSQEEIGEIVKSQYEVMVKRQSDNPTSPYYIGPALLPDRDDVEFFYQHPHSAETDFLDSIDFESRKSNKKISDLAATIGKEERVYRKKLQEKAEIIDQMVFDELGIEHSTRENIRQEIFLRTSEKPEDREVPHPESVPEIADNLDKQVKDLVHHFAMEAVREESEGIIPLEGADDQADMLDRIVEQFENKYGEYAEDRLVEVDNILGAESAANEAYPNLRSFINDDLFTYHVDMMENTPIIWKLSTERLLADQKGEGFACFVDYHQLNASLFDRLSNQYLEPRKAELRDRRSAANQQRNDESLSTSERADATDEFEFCSSALEQIAELEEVMQNLGSISEREFDDEDRRHVNDLAPKVATFREETAKRIETVKQLRERNGEEWFQDKFSGGFWNKVDQWRAEWIDALEELERACEEYARPSDEPVEAHLADLFDYFNWRLKGSDHYSSSGILFMTYYFEREGGDLLNEDGEPFENLTEDEKMLASLATGIDDKSMINEDSLKEIAEGEDVDGVAELPPIAEFKSLAEEIEHKCDIIYNKISSDWSERALSEITTAGYQPNRKHGVAINITPLTEKNIVPEVVDDKVL